MFAPRLVNLIETHSEKLAESLVHKFETSEKLGDYRKVPPPEMRQRAYDVYHNLSDWLLTKTEEEIEKRYMEVGARRAAQGVSMSSVIFALSLTKEHLWDYVRREALVDRHVELCQELELLQLVEQFFDRAIYYTARGYERSRAARAA